MRLVQINSKLNPKPHKMCSSKPLSEGILKKAVHSGKGEEPQKVLKVPSTFKYSSLKKVLQDITADES